MRLILAIFGIAQDMGFIKIFVTILGLLGTLFWLNGCAQLVIPGTLAGAGEYMRYTTTNVPKRTMTGSQRQVSTATFQALKKLNIKSPPRQTTGDDSPITATTAELIITITLEPVTPSTTRVTVDAASGQITKDKATADKILDQIQAELDAGQSGSADLSRISIKNNCNSPIDVAIHYLNGGDDAGTWQSDGWFRLAPGENRPAVNTPGRYIYFYAVSSSNNSSEWSGEYIQSLQGGRYGFFKIDLGAGEVDFIQSFNCD